jgi:hypothetical protein
MSPSNRNSSLSDHTSDLLMSNCGCDEYSAIDPKATAEFVEILWSPIGMLGMVGFAAIAVVYCITYKG